MRRLAPASLAACVLILAPAAFADTGTLSGKLTDGKLPSASNGRAYVRAISVPDGHVVGGTQVSRSGAWKLQLEPGAYVLTASVVTPAKSLDAMAPVQRVRAGRTTRTPVSLERRRAPAVKRKRKSARAAAAPSAAIGIGPFTGTGPNAQLGKGLADMLITSMTGAQSGDCTAQVVEVEHRADLLREIALSNSKLADPRSRLRTDQLIDPAVLVRGSVATTATSATWTLEIVDQATGNVIGGDSGSANGLDIFTAPDDIAQRLLDQICGPDYQVTIEINAMVVADSYVGTGLMTAVVPVRAQPGPGVPSTWTGRENVVFGALSYGGVPGCNVVPDPHTGYARVEINRASAPETIEVTWGGESFTGTQLVCPGVTIPNGVPPIQPFQGTVPTLLIFSASGGSQQVAGGLGGAGAGWINNGTVTVTRFPHGTL
jgi:hypothetical protein